MRMLLFGTMLWAGTLPAAAESRAVGLPPDPPTECSPDTTSATRTLDTLPLALLTYLESIQESLFAQAFLIRHLAANEDPNHWLAVCARGFLNAELTDVSALRGRRSSLRPDLILQELRVAEEARLTYERRLGERRAGLLSAVEGVRRALDSAAPDESGLQGEAEYLSATKQTLCESRAGALCASLPEVDSLLTALIAEVRLIRHTEAQLRQLREERAQLDEVATRLDTTISRLAADLAALDTLASAELDSVRARLQGERTRRDEILRQVEGLEGGINQAVETLSTLRSASPGRREALDVALDTLRVAAEAVDPDADDWAGPPRQERWRLQAEHGAPPPGAPVVHVAAAPSQDVLMGLTDFVISRAKEELVLLFLERMFRTDDRLVRAAFPTTFALVERVSDGERPSALAIGRIPLSVWRATLTHDYRRLPRTLLATTATELCSTQECRDGVEPLTVAAEVGYRIIDGEQAFRVLSTAREWRPRLRNDAMETSVRMLELLATAYRVQGWTGSALHRHAHPYLLSARSMTGSDAQQQTKAFLRLLVTDATPPDGSLGAGLEEARMLAALQGVLRSLDALAGLLSPEGAESVRTGTAVKGALAALVSSLQVAEVLSGTADRSEELATLAERWRQTAGAIEAFAAHDYGLAMAQTTVLLMTVRQDERLPTAFHTVAGLAVGLAEAQDGAQVRAAFEAAAAPVGGWRNKRVGESRRPTVSAYPGATYGREWLVPGYGNESITFGAALPIGLEVQTPRGLAPAWSLGLLLQVIDLGSLVNYRISDDEDVEPQPNVSVPQVFAPGLYVVLGLGNTPLSLLAGGQFNPELRTLRDLNDSGIGSAFQLRVALGVDVVLLNF